MATWSPQYARNLNNIRAPTLGRTWQAYLEAYEERAKAVPLDALIRIVWILKSVLPKSIDEIIAPFVSTAKGKISCRIYSERLLQ
jgi:hypothetical protein